MGYSHERFLRRLSATLIQAEPLGASGSDLVFKANTTDAYPKLSLEGNTYIILDVKTDLICKWRGAQMLKMNFATPIANMYGGGLTGNDLYIFANSTDVLPVIQLHGNGKVNVNATSGADVELTTGGAGRVRFGAYVATPATDSTGYIEIKDAGGTTRKVMVQA